MGHVKINGVLSQLDSLWVSAKGELRGGMVLYLSMFTDDTTCCSDAGWSPALLR